MKKINNKCVKNEWLGFNKTNTNYADEFDVDSFWVATREEYNNFLKELKDKEFDEFRSVDIYFGTNECISFTSIQEILDSLIVTDISAQFAWLLIEHFGEEYGLISIPNIPEYIYISCKYFY